MGRWSRETADPSAALRFYFQMSNGRESVSAKKRAPRVRGQSALVLSLCESFYAALVLGLRRSIPGGGLRVRLLRRAYW
jgi:hypothetical protein